MFVDHLVFIVQDVARTEAFYTKILGEPMHRTDDFVVYEVDGTKLFFGLPYGQLGGSAEKTRAW